jgi:DNA-binding winged helix-turn-helix (wHTH) protein/tetratricopeptide (TPR) repeat protein
MPPPAHLLFGPFRLDVANEQLWKGTEHITLQRRPFSVLRYLAEHPQQLVHKEALVRAVWGNTYVSDTATTRCIRVIRKALGDDPGAPTFIKTVHGRGFRFIGEVVSSQVSVVSRQGLSSERPQLATGDWQLTTLLVGREAEFAQLYEWWARALDGERQVVFVTGEAGASKTALVNEFVKHLAADETVRVGWGQCIEEHGPREPYRPLLEALTHMGQHGGTAQMVEMFKLHAPAWLLRLPPSWLSPEERDELRRGSGEITRERMLRQLTEVIERLAHEQPLVLVLEDLHWSDLSTLEALDSLTRQSSSAKLLVIGTYRPEEAPLTASARLSKEKLLGMVGELHAHEHCQTLPLAPLTEPAVRQYLVGRWRQSPVTNALVRDVHARTEGNALFMVHVVEDLVPAAGARHVGVALPVAYKAVRRMLHPDEAGTPRKLRDLLATQLARLGKDQTRLLKAASVAGTEFAVAALAAALGQTPEEVEEGCEELAQQGRFLQEVGVVQWPDGTLSGGYRFRHQLYQQVLYERLAAVRRVHLHRRIAERLESGYGERAREIAVELAVHWTHGREPGKAIRYWRLGAENALASSAYQEASDCAEQGLALVEAVPETPQRTLEEIWLYLALGTALIPTKTPADPQVEHAYRRAHELCQQMGNSAQILPALHGLRRYYNYRGNHQEARSLAEHLLVCARREDSRAYLPWALLALGETLWYCGEMPEARKFIEQSLAVYDPQRHETLVSGHNAHPAAGGLGYQAASLWFLGYPDQALRDVKQALALADTLDHPFSVTFVHFYSALLSQFLQEPRNTQTHAEEALASATEQGFVFYRAVSILLKGWALLRQGQERGLDLICQSLDVYQATGAAVGQTWALALQGEAYGIVGQPEEGLRALTEALSQVDQTGEHVYEAEIYRLKGQLTLQQFQVSGSKFQVVNPQSTIRSPQSEAEACFRKAITVARRQRAKSLELRATVSLARLWQQQGKTAQAQRWLAKIYGWFTEGFDTVDLKEAQALLEELAREKNVR